MNFATKVNAELNDLRRQIVDLKEQIRIMAEERKDDMVFIKSAKDTLRSLLDYEIECRR